jgi:anti-sigma regulatory factor (Ser/Thr protein kinase)
MGTNSKQLVLKNTISELRMLANAVKEFCEENSFSGEVTHDMRLVLEEIFSNIVFYGFHDQDEHLIAISLTLRNNTLVLEINDDGIPFNPLESKTPDLAIPIEERETGGMGIHIASELVDEIEYIRKYNKNILVMKKNNILTM